MFESIPSQDNSREDPVNDGRTFAASSEKEPSPDMPLDALQLEEIADVRGEIASRLFVDNIPAEKWQEVSDTILAKHPNLRDYKRFFRNVLAAALKRHERVEELWDEEGVSALDSTSRPMNVNLAEADPRSSERLFRMIFGSEVGGRVEAVKGKFSLTFIVDENDKDNAYRSSTTRGQYVDVTPMGFALPSREIPVIVVSRNRREPQAEYVTTVHEAEHITNGILREGRHRTLRQTGDERKDRILKKILTREVEGLPVEEAAKDELLAQFTYLRLLEGSRGTNAELDEKFDEVAEQIINNIRTTFGPGTYYFKQYHELYSPTKEETERYEQSVARGIDAYARLWQLLKKNKPKGHSRAFDNVFFKVNNILEQFPLYKWPAAVRLFEMRDRTGAVRSNSQPGIHGG